MQGSEEVVQDFQLYGRELKSVNNVAGVRQAAAASTFLTYTRLTHMKLGYIIASHEVTLQGKRVGYIYREEPDNDRHSGWRVFSGEETEEFAQNADNFSMYNASTIVDHDPSIAALLAQKGEVAFERNSESDGFFQADPLDAE